MQTALGTPVAVPQEIEVCHFDPHVHGRRGPMQRMLLTQAAKRMCGGILEPNTYTPHLYTYDDITAYSEESNALTPDCWWTASCYLTPHTSITDVVRAWEAGVLGHVKGYPPHGTTHSNESVPPEMLLDINSGPGKVLCAMAEAGIPFKTHGEVVEKDGKQVHPLLREGLWYREVQPRFDDLYRERGLRQIHAHITTADAAIYMLSNGDPDARVCEVTGHHLIQDWNILYDGGALRPDYHWLPVSKNARHTDRLRQLVVMRKPYVIGASDMAGHDTKGKYGPRAFGGGYTYHCSLELYIQALEMMGALDFADAFLYGNAKRFHGRLVPHQPTPFRLVREDWTVGERVQYEGGGDEDGKMTPFGFDENPERRFVFRWKLVQD